MFFFRNFVSILPEGSTFVFHVFLLNQIFIMNFYGQRKLLILEIRTNQKYYFS